LTYFTPSSWRTLNGHDVDLGGCPLLLMPGTRLLLTGGKDGNLYLVNADSMGGLGGGVQSFSIASSEIKGGFVAFNSPVGLLAYVQPANTPLKAFKMVSGVFNPTTPFWTSTIPAPTGLPGGQLWLSGTGTNAILWETVPVSQNAEHASVPGILRAFDPSTGVEIYDSYQNQARDDFGDFAKNPSPVVANGKVYVPTFSGSLAVYGLGPATNSPPPPPNPPTGLTAKAARQPGKITLTWTQSTSPGITANKVYRSTTGSGGPYSLLATLSPSTTYTDTGLTKGATYFYEVTAVNSGGESAVSNYAGATSN